DDQFTDFEIDADLLLAFDHEVAVGQHLRDHGGDISLQRFLAVDRAFAFARGRGIRGENAAGNDGFGIGRQDLAAHEIGDAGILGVFAAALGLVLHIGLVGDVDRYGQDVADLVRAL